MDVFGEVAERVLRKSWSDEDVIRYVGSVKAAFLSHASSEEVRALAASGGTTSALLLFGLRHGWFEGAVVCQRVIIDGRVRPSFSIATTPEAVLAGRGSTYIETRFVRDVIPLIQQFHGRVAVVGLPCDISALRRHGERRPEIGSKVALTIALVCGHNSRTELIDQITTRLTERMSDDLVDYRFRVGHWRGQQIASFTNGETVSQPFRKFSTYQNLYVCAERKCLSCADHYGYEADISTGDVWLYRLKSDPIKRTGVITRTERGHDLFTSAVDDCSVNAEAIDVRIIMDGQSRIGPSHYNVTARARAGRLLGVTVRDPVNTKVKWHELVNAIMSVGAMKLSESRHGRRVIFMTPAPVLRFALFLKKGLESLR